MVLAFSISKPFRKPLYTNSKLMKWNDLDGARMAVRLLDPSNFVMCISSFVSLPVVATRDGTDRLTVGFQVFPTWCSRCELFGCVAVRAYLYCFLVATI